MRVSADGELVFLSRDDASLVSCDDESSASRDDESPASCDDESSVSREGAPGVERRARSHLPAHALQTGPGTSATA